ncbi:MAG: hypothetical protein V2A34_10245 [Lentisphaerota bacterium]
MNMERNDNEREWRYVLDGMNEKEREAFSEEIRRNPELKNRVDQLSRVKSNLDILVPLSELSQEDLREHIFQEMNNAVFKTRQEGEIIPFPQQDRTSPARSAWAYGSIAALAASLLLLIGGALRSPLAWQTPSILQQASYRDNSGKEIFAGFSKQELQAFAKTLQKQIEAQYREKAAVYSSFNLRRLYARDWSMSLTFQETQPGKLAVTVAAQQTQQPQTHLEWVAYYGDAQELHGKSPVFADQIATKLVQTHENTGAK